MNLLQSFEAIISLKEQPKYTIATDCYDEEVNSYCLVRTFNKQTDFIMLKTIKDKKEFDEEVSNLAKYFNAKIIKSL